MVKTRVGRSAVGTVPESIDDLLSQLEVSPMSKVVVSTYKNAMVRKHSNLIGWHDQQIRWFMNRVISPCSGISFFVATGLWVSWILSIASTYPRLHIFFGVAALAVTAVFITAIVLHRVLYNLKVVIATWVPVPLEHAVDVPKEVMETAGIIKNRFPRVAFRVEILRKEGRILDPFLVLVDGEREEYIMVWDETGYVHRLT